MYKKITKPYKYKFSIKKDGIYAVSIEASCKTRKDDLRVEIDKNKFREIPEKKRASYLNIPAAWNGSKLKGLSKIVIFIIELEQGEHIIEFIPNGKPTIKKLSIEEIGDVFTLENVRATDRNRQPWITVVLVDLPLKSLSTFVKC